MHYKCRLPIDGLGQCKAREAYGESLRFLYALNPKVSAGYRENKH